MSGDILSGIDSFVDGTESADAAPDATETPVLSSPTPQVNFQDEPELQTAHEKYIESLSSPAPSAPAPAEDGAATDSTSNSAPEAAPPTEPPASATPETKFIKLSTFDLDATNLTPEQIAKIVRNDEVLRQTQSNGEKLRRQVENASRTTGTETVKPPDIPIVNAQSKGTSDAEIRAAWDAYVEDATFENHQKYQGLREAKLASEFQAKADEQVRLALKANTEALYRNGLLATPELRRVAETERERGENELVTRQAQDYMNGLSELGVDLKDVPADKVGANFRALTQEAQNYKGENGETVDTADPMIVNELWRMAIKEARTSVTPAAPITPVSTPPVPNRVAAPKADVPPNKLNIALPRSAPGRPSVPNSSQGSSDPFGLNLTEEQIRNNPLGDLLALI